MSIVVPTAEAVNTIANDDSVRQMMFLGMRYPENHLDFTTAVEDERTVVLESNGFCALFNWSAPGIYECHIMALKNARGAHAMQAGRLMLEHMWGLGATRVWGQPSVYNRAAICYIRRMGLKPAGFGKHGVLGEVQYFMTEDHPCRP